MKPKIIIMISLCLIYLSTIAQTDTSHIEPEIGKRCPDFVIRNIKYYPKKQASLKDFQGKWLLLDFWDKQCGACIASFPHMNAMQKEFGNQLQIMMVGIQDREKEIESLYARFRKKENLIMPCAFDSLVVNRFPAYSMPYLLLIDDKGIVRHIGKIDDEDLKEFLSGHPPILIPIDSLIAYDPEKPFLINNNGGKNTDYQFRSVLSDWKPVVNRGSVPDFIGSEETKKGKLQVLGSPLEYLYRLAYFGKPGWDYSDSTFYGNIYEKPILEIQDSSLFQYSYKTGKNVYSYSVEMPTEKSTIEHIEETMQSDLRNYFRFEAHVETRKMPYWKLVATPQAKIKLKSKGRTELLKGSPKISYKAQNIPFKNFLTLLQYYITGKEIILNETGITDNIDISMDCKDCIFTNIKDVKKALQANGLDLLPSKKEMKVLVIRDTKLKTN